MFRLCCLANSKIGFASRIASTLPMTLKIGPIPLMQRKFLSEKSSHEIFTEGIGKIMKTLDELKAANVEEKVAIQEKIINLKEKVDKLTEENAKLDGKFGEVLKVMNENLKKKASELQEEIKKEFPKALLMETENNNINIYHSPMKITKEKFIWTIENFSAREQETGEYLKSGDFISFSPSGKRLKWYLSIYPNGDREEAKGYVSIFLHLIYSAGATQISAKPVFYIRDSKGVDREKKDVGYYNFKQNGPGWGYDKFFKRDQLLNEENCPGDLLSIICEVSVRSEKIELITSDPREQIE